MVPEEFLITPSRKPRFRILVFSEYLEKTELELKEILRKNELLQFYSIEKREPFSVRYEQQFDPLVIPIFLTIDPWQFLRDIGTMVTLGRAFIDIINYLRKRHSERKIYRYTVNCSATFFTSLAFLNMQGVAIGKPLYFHSFGFQCLLIASDSLQNNMVHVVIYSNEGELIDYVALSL